MGGGQGAGTLTQYVRAGYPTSISYGYQLSDAINGAKPSAQVLFGTSQRCLTSSTFANCAYSNLSSSTASNWPDVPYDEIPPREARAPSIPPRSGPRCG